MNLDEFRQYVTAQRKESMAQALTALTAIINNPTEKDSK